jgi:RecB family exonuclease
MTDDEFDRALWSLPLVDDWERMRIDAMAARAARRGELVGVIVGALKKAGRLDRVDARITEGGELGPGVGEWLTVDASQVGAVQAQ